MDFTSSEEKHTKKSTQKLSRLLKKRDTFPRRLFLVAFENLVVFGVPAGLAVYIGTQTGHFLPALVLALLFSWIFFFIRFWMFLRAMNKLEKEIEEEQSRAGVSKSLSEASPEIRKETDEQNLPLRP